MALGSKKSIPSSAADESKSVKGVLGDDDDDDDEREKKRRVLIPLSYDT